MSKELQDKADRMIRELKEALVPIKEELKKLKNSSDDRRLNQKTR
jgi:hypothetical protein